MRMITGLLTIFIVGGSSLPYLIADTLTLAQQTAEEIRVESLRSNSDPIGRPLPVLASWNTALSRPGPTIGPAYQIHLVEQGHHVLPSFAFPNISSDAGGDAGANHAAIEKFREYYEGPLKRAAELQLPIALVGTQWERLLSDDMRYFELPAEQNPNVVTPTGEILDKVSPFGPVDYWSEVGAKWASSPLMKQVQEWYPNPPLVILLSNNEHRRLRWKDAETDRRYLKQYGTDRDDAFKRRVVGEGWIERHRALHDGMREALSSEWRDKAVFMGYGDFGPSYFGRWSGWPEYALHIPGRIDPAPLAWDGMSPSYYTHHWNVETDFQVYSPQIESMNWVFMRRMALQLNPEFRCNFSIWDGHMPPERARSGAHPGKREVYRSLGQEYGPSRYGGFAQFGLWLLRPREMREYRWQSTMTTQRPYFLKLAECIDRVYDNETLRHFWRRGELVPNHEHSHPYQSGIPAEYRDEDRWFLLETDLDPPRPWKLDTEIPVFSLALVDGEHGSRRWLIYAHSPLKDRSAVELTVPGYGQITVAVPIDGAFYIVDEESRDIQKIE